MFHHEALEVILQRQVFHGVAVAAAGFALRLSQAGLAAQAVDIHQLQVYAQGFVIYLVPVGEDNRSLDGVFQLPHVPGPLVGGYGLDRARGELHGRLAKPLGLVAQQALCQVQDVLAALAQGWQRQLQYVDAVKQVLAEAAIGGQAVQVAVGGADQAHIDLARMH